MSEDWAVMVYTREVTLQHYGESEHFGKYDQETQELTITNEQAMGTLTKAWVQAYCDSGKALNNLGSHVLFGVPKKVYELREQHRYTPLHEL